MRWPQDDDDVDDDGDDVDDDDDSDDVDDTPTVSDVTCLVFFQDFFLNSVLEFVFRQIRFKNWSKLNLAPRFFFCC